MDTSAFPSYNGLVCPPSLLSFSSFSAKYLFHRCKSFKLTMTKAAISKLNPRMNKTPTVDPIMTAIGVAEHEANGLKAPLMLR